MSIFCNNRIIAYSLNIAYIRHVIKSSDFITSFNFQFPYSKDIFPIHGIFFYNSTNDDQSYMPRPCLLHLRYFILTLHPFEHLFVETKRPNKFDARHHFYNIANN